MIDKNLLDILVCPESGEKLVLENNELICKKSKLAYPIIDEIPVLLKEEARKL